jgi:hypothetical protein
VLLLLIAQQKPKKAARAIRAILDTTIATMNNGSTVICSLLALALLRNPKDLKVADNSLSTEILEPLVELEVSNSPQVSYKVRDAGLSNPLQSE